MPLLNGIKHVWAAIFFFDPKGRKEIIGSVEEEPFHVQ